MGLRADLAAALRAGRAAFLAAGGDASVLAPDGSPAVAVVALRGRRAGAFLAAGLSPVDAAEIAGAAGVAGGAALMGSGATVGAGAAGAVAAPLAPLLICAIRILPCQNALLRFHPG